MAAADAQHENDLIAVGIAGLTHALHSIAQGANAQTHVWMVSRTAWPLGEAQKTAIRAAFPRASFVMAWDSAVDCPPGSHLSYPLNPCPIKDDGAIAAINRPYIEGDSAWVDVSVNHAAEGMTFARIKGIWTFIRYYKNRSA
jgi:hypothetical protein